MQDLTTGSVTRHLLKTTSFMLVTMVFQTFVLPRRPLLGRPAREGSRGGVGVAGNLTFIVLALSQMLGVGTTALVSHAAGRKEHERAVLLFNQSQVLSLVLGRDLLRRDDAIRLPYSRTLGARRSDGDSRGDYLLWFIPAMSLQFAMVAMGAALRGTGNFKPA
jgi:Na+-driven multidrug efflux pump